MCNLSMASPEKPNMAGRTVTAASMTRSTAAITPMASPRMNGRFRIKRPSSDKMTVVPANRTERPDVARDTIVAWRGSRPSARPWR